MSSRVKRLLKKEMTNSAAITQMSAKNFNEYTKGVTKILADEVDSLQETIPANNRMPFKEMMDSLDTAALDEVPRLDILRKKTKGTLQ